MGFSLVGDFSLQYSVFCNNLLNNIGHKLKNQMGIVATWAIISGGYTNITLVSFHTRDGQLKRMKVKDNWKQKSQQDYSKLIKVDWKTHTVSSFLIHQPSDRLCMHLWLWCTFLSDRPSVSDTGHKRSEGFGHWFHFQPPSVIVLELKICLYKYA